MPTYQNDNATEGYMVRDIYDENQLVMPGESVETFEDVSGWPDLTETDASPTNIKTIEAQNLWTDGVRVRRGTRQLNISISGVSDSTVTLQRSEDDGVTYKDVQTFDASAESYLNDARDDAVYRIGIKTGDYGTDTVVVKLSK